MLDDRGPARLVDRNLEELRDPADLAGHVALETGEVHEANVREIADLPPGPDVVPERPERMPVAIHPFAPVLADVARWALDRWVNAAGRLVQRRVPRLVRVG